MSRIRIVIVVGLAAPLLFGCEQFFSNNLLSGARRDPSQLSFDQQISYAESARNSGDKEAMADAYAALSETLEEENNTDPELNRLAAELAVGASGLTDTVPDLLDAAVQGDLSNKDDVAASVNDALDEVDYDYINEAADQIDKIKENGGTVSKEQYVFVGAGLMMEDAEEAGGVENIDPSSESKQFADEAAEDLESRGEDAGLIGELSDLYGE
jgi:hypothetical protein